MNDRMHLAKKQTLGGIEDLPDGILHCILSLLPMKSVVRTSVLSKRWRDLWKEIWVQATTLDFGEEFTNAETPEEFVDTVNRYIELHSGRKIERFRIFFLLPKKFQADAEKWICFAISKGVQELDLDFGEVTDDYDPCCFDDEIESLIKFPSFVMSHESVTCLKLSCCDFNPLCEFARSSSVRTLELRRVTITDETLEILLSNCPLLECLSLRECFDLKIIKVSDPNLRLRSLKVVNCWNAFEIEILAPHLQSFYFYGDLFYGYLFRNVNSLEDVFISSVNCEHLEPEHDYINLLMGISHIKILTICSGPLMAIDMSEYISEDLPITFPNLKELQLLMVMFDIEYLDYIYSFFKLTRCVCLERLFIELPSNPSHASTERYSLKQVKEPLGCIFDDLRTIKINNFRGSDVEMRLVKFFLWNAVKLESLVLVLPQRYCPQKGINDMKMVSTAQSQSQWCKTRSRLIRYQLSILPKVSDKTWIVLCEQGKDESGLYPTHTEYYVRV